MNDLADLWTTLKDSTIKSDDSLKPLPSEINKEVCYHCSNSDLKVIDGSYVCCNCGTINDMILDYSAEWRFYGSEDSKFSDPTRCGMPTNELLPQSSLGSTISYNRKETYDMRRIRTNHMYNAMPYKERSLYNVFDSITIRAINSGIPNCIIEEAKNLYKRIADTKISRGSNRKGIIASCIYKACVIHNSHRTPQEIAEIFKISTTCLTKGCKNFENIMNLSNTQNVSTNASTSLDFIRRFCSHLNIGKNILSICEHVCNKAEEFNLVSKCIPPSIAAGSIYLVISLINNGKDKIRISKQDISEKCRISEVTISKCYKELLKYHEHLLPKDILEQLYI
jgi:transcription initiation factor TFIIB